MKKNPGKFTKYMVAMVGILLGIVAYQFTHLWILCGMGFALALAAYVQD